MQRLFRTLLILFVVAGISSCDVLDNQNPQQSLPVDKSLETVSDYRTALVGTYNSLQEFDNGDSAAQLLFANDIITADAVWTGSFPTYVQIAQQQMAITNGSIEGQWNGAYVAINNANIIIDGIDKVDASQTAIDNIKGQALFIRALEYYYLVNYFAKPWGATADNSHLGVPLQLRPVTKQGDFKSPLRSPVDSVYSQIKSDLQQAEQLISLSPSTFDKRNRASSDAATALRARIALIQERWQEAANLSNEFITSNDYVLESDVTTFFRSEGSDESIFEVQNTTQDVPDPANTAITAVYNVDTRDDIQISVSYKNALQNIVNEEQEAMLDAADQNVADTRVTLLTTAGADGVDSLLTPPDVRTASDADNTTKYEDNVNASDNLPILRLPEMILTRAEALAEINGVNQESVDLLNQIRTRAIEVTESNGDPTSTAAIEYSVGDFSSKQELIDAILLERRVELAFEGHHKTDLQRREKDVNGTAWDADQLVFPIPQSQCDANSEITQNPGYGSCSQEGG